MARAKGRGPAVTKTQERAEFARSAFEQRYPEFQYRFVEFLVEHLVDLSREFRGDLQTPMILAIIGQVMIHSLQRDGSAAKDGSIPAAISASRIADITGISRQTIRRKLAALERLGWIEQLPDRSWRIRVHEGRAAAHRDLAQLDARQISRAAVLFAELERLLATQS
jgi:DNA-binding MarR family transcriptional regulator